MTTTTRQVTAATSGQARIAGAAKVTASLPEGTPVTAVKAVKAVTTKAQRETIARHPAEQPWDVTVEYDLAQAVELTERAADGQHAAHIAAGTYAPKCPTCVELRAAPAHEHKADPGSDCSLCRDRAARPAQYRPITAHEFVPTRSGKCDVCGRDKRTASHLTRR